MGPSANPESPRSADGKWFVITGLLLLIFGTFFGVIGGLQYVVEGLFKTALSFDRVRPLHVSSVVFWIILAATGIVLTYIQAYTGKSLRFPRLIRFQWILFAGAIGAILVSYALGIFGGREYWEFPPVLALPILLGWIAFLANVAGSLRTLRRQPVFVWQWLTGAVFFLFTFVESYLWVIPYFRENVVNDMTIQWKSYGSMVGAWNMLIYGSSMFLMSRIAGDASMARSRTAFALYFTGLFNLMFNWGHHIYTLPTHDYIKHISYAVSMTELFIIGRIIWQWRSALTTAQRHAHLPAYRFIISADIWVFLTLLLAVAMSVPAINVYTHGTHITVAHTMGATIGINTFLLLAMATDLAGPRAARHRLYRLGYWLANAALPVFWISLIVAGVMKAGWQMSDARAPFSTMMRELRPAFIVFAASGTVLMAGLWLAAIPLIRGIGSRGRAQPHE